MSKTLVIVESPTKARTIAKYLPKGYHVVASMGHVRDLPQSSKEIPEKVRKEDWATLGVDVKNDFSPLYVIPFTKKKVVNELKAQLKDSKDIILATDEDREGESISWHLLEVLKPKGKVKRMVFHEITKEAILEALNQCRDIDERLVRAQETRRILDRLVGYRLSPLIWKKIAYGLSAGRVQSVAVRLVVERERARRLFKQAAYWDLKASLIHSDTPFAAEITSLGGKKIASGKDFDEQTGQLTPGRDVVLLNVNEARHLKDRLLNKTWRVESVEEKPVTRRPSPPFVTSTLQQEANRKLGLSAKETMRVAQGLYENGFITYMRTDSVHLSGQAIGAARRCVEELYGSEYLSPQARQYSTKSKGAQEAHEAIRPAGHTFRIPKETGLHGREFALYDLIWKRTMATQMADSQQTQITVDLTVEDAQFRATGKRIEFAGFFRAYVEGSDDPEAAIESNEVILPKLKEGDQPRCLDIECLDHQTQPPARYTEASLIKKLESEGIGRPSTYASILSTIEDRGYVDVQNKALVPTFTAFAVTHLLEEHFPELVDVTFTAKMEETLDNIAEGNAEWLPYLKTFYLGKNGLDQQVKEHEHKIDPEEARTVKLSGLNAIIKIGKYGAYVESESSGEMVRATVPNSIPPADLNEQLLEKVLRDKEHGPQSLGKHPQTKLSIYVLTGRFGDYVQMGMSDDKEEKKKLKKASLPKGMKPEAVTLDVAVQLLSLPRDLGVHPKTSGRIFVNNGRFGPFVCHEGPEGKEYRSIKKSTGDDVFTLTLDRAIELLNEPKKASRFSRTKKQDVIRDLGPHPKDKKPVQILNGRYGPYIKHAKTNVTVPKGREVETFTMEEVVKMLAEKKGKKRG